MMGSERSGMGRDGGSWGRRGAVGDGGGGVTATPERAFLGDVLSVTRPVYVDADGVHGEAIQDAAVSVASPR
jgi:hypothetical protein